VGEGKVSLGGGGAKRKREGESLMEVDSGPLRPAKR